MDSKEENDSLKVIIFSENQVMTLTPMTLLFRTLPIPFTSPSALKLLSLISATARSMLKKTYLVLVYEVPIDQKRKLERHKKRKEHDKVARDGGVSQPVNQGSMVVAEDVERDGSFVVADDRLSQ